MFASYQEARLVPIKGGGGTKLCPNCGSVSVYVEIQTGSEPVYYCCCCGSHFVGGKDIREINKT